MLSFLNLALKRQSDELYRIVNSIKVISLALTVTMSGWAEVSRISAGMVDGELSVALNPCSLSPSWRYSLKPLAKIFKALSCHQVYLPCARDTGQPFNMH